mgnify:FL=1
MGSVTNKEIVLEEASRALLADALVWDNHQCMPLRPEDTSFLPQLQRCKTAGCDVVSLNISFDAVPWENGIQLVATMRHWLKQHSDDYILVETIRDIERARSENKLAVTFDIEGGVALVDHLPMVQFYYDLGVRWMLFAYNLNNSLGGGCNDEPAGLTDFGRQVLREMERVGMVVCCSHTSHETVMDMMEMAENPVIFSHSNPAALKAHYRNVKDEAIKACANTGGVIAINGIGEFLGDNDDRTETMVRHIDYCVQLVGADHVAIGTDYCFDQQELVEFLEQNPDVFDDKMRAEGLRMVKPEQIPEIADYLLRMNYIEQDVRNILGENHLRVARAVWK